MRFAVLCVLAAAALSCGSEGGKSKPDSQLPRPAAAETSGRNEPAEPETRVEMVNVKIRLDPQLILHIRHLSGKLIRTEKGQIPRFDDKLSYFIAADSAEIALSMASLSHMMNTYVFGDPGAPLKDLQFTIENGKVKQKGTITKGPGIPFETLGDVGPTPDGLIKIHPVKMRVAHLPVKGLLKLFGVDMAEIINTRHTRGIRVDDNDIILDPAQVLPPPKMKGRVSAVRVEGNGIVQIFGTEQEPPATKRGKSNYMAYRGGILSFGKLTMHDTDLRLIDAYPNDPFDFSPDHYKDHLVAGYSKTTVSGGLLVYMPDYGKISKPLSPAK